MAMGACWWLSEDMEYDCASEGVAMDQHTHRVCHREGVYYGLLSFPCGSAGKESTCNAGDIRDVGSIPGSRRAPGEGKGYTLQYSCLENPMDRGAWWATVHRVTKNQTQLK